MCSNGRLAIETSIKYVILFHFSQSEIYVLLQKWLITTLMAEYLVLGSGSRNEIVYFSH